MSDFIINPTRETFQQLSYPKKGYHYWLPLLVTIIGYHLWVPLLVTILRDKGA